MLAAPATIPVAEMPDSLHSKRQPETVHGVFRLPFFLAIFFQSGIDFFKKKYKKKKKIEK